MQVVENGCMHNGASHAKTTNLLLGKLTFTLFSSMLLKMCAMPFSYLKLTDSRVNSPSNRLHDHLVRMLS